ncbi:hypothetical protein BO86DRAFT_435796 [Aspergillus japonicus CBS 114.51]|uniref:Uncharacterized protein n=1 Tax=Aspergillus japonicus CBS 114.51 TaxID=1448312 RepID=A0A8T8WV30_ASPJA|nr:hypothetical protein BO86DRAFT_435796 [Aspergillus japonicus CBS 114.51]RAH79685.1 hypothetical protein BO86DRAFT_435796 [Aspergillus japonicus CBS 114.51]
MPHHCTVCKDTVKLHCVRRGHVTECTELSCKLPYQSSREKDCPYCRNALQKRAAREGSIPKDTDESDDAMLASAGGNGDSDKENDSPDGVRAQRQRQQRQQRQPQPKKQKKKKGKHVRETRKLKDIRRSRPGKLK